ncbi:MAG TPA: cupredoxin domain-containing protein, partial [Dehalococcoidia bacterium]|nr:cupredoxin domain-containing protein [Dehalococcoidia bacterium]
CSGDDDNSGKSAAGPTVDTSSLMVENQPSPVQPPVGTPAQPEEGVFEIFVESAQYHGNSINATAGQSIVIRVTNRDQITHNLRIAGLDGQYDTEDDAVTEPDAIPGGTSGQLDFAPAIRGAYTFRCDYHPGSMGGQIIVQ